MAELPKDESLVARLFFGFTMGGMVEKGDMGVQKVVAGNGFNSLKLADFSAFSPERKATNAVVLKERALPKLCEQHLIISASYVVILSHRDIQTKHDVEQVLEAVPEGDYRNMRDWQRDFSSWEKTVSRILGNEIGKGTFVDKVA